MAEINDGGWAFPGDLGDGMKLRDYFAAKAMQSFITTSQHGAPFGNSDAGRKNCDNVAFVSYEMADAMLRARSAP